MSTKPVSSKVSDVQLAINAVALLSPLTGIGQYTYHLISELHQLLPRPPHLFYATSWSQELRTTPLPHLDAFKRLAKRFLPRARLLSRLVQQSHFSRGIKERGIELYHEPNFLAFRYRGPSVVTVHDLSWVRHPETHPPERVRALQTMLPKVLAKADHILVDSEFVRGEVMTHYGISGDRVSAVLLGVKPEFRPASALLCDAVLTPLQLTYGRYILAVGTLEPRKNLSSVLQAFALLPEAVRRHYPLVIAGGKGWGMAQFTADVRQMIERGEVRLTGYVAQDDLPLLYAGARMLVYPSLYEGFGLPPLEAMASGVPVISSNRASMPEVIGTAGVLLEPLDVNAISIQMQQLIEDVAYHQRLSVAGRARSLEFTWRQCALDTLAVYQKVLA
ncbi:glycosyltransferase family 1 protein [Glaciimonas sp. PAMC28666]|uniref:glycosyltransferase family 4 protein n=1 Tax=Glaciimonas sp. PAMC28666 TaxID=2807626 RepID=UPI001962AF8B|nr:glycosyltransferase family 1 protein [Glaciimonas sp. PAMC28666]QRX84525.1 glycosyltransferase family 4 protein [Glaciimonas sp. PAMC28666]